MKLLSIQDFAGAANQTFDLTMGGDTTVPMTLVEVRPLTPHPVGVQMRAPFSLMFRSASQVVLPQRTYSMRNAVMGALEIFLVPVARDVQGVHYQAVFN